MLRVCFFFFFNETAPTAIYTLSLRRRSSGLDVGGGEAASGGGGSRMCKSCGKRGKRLQHRAGVVSSGKNGHRFPFLM